jgi:hypothetical protein
MAVKIVYRDIRSIGREQCEGSEVEHVSSVCRRRIYLLYNSATVNGQSLLAEPKLTDISCGYNQVGNERPL